MSEDKSLESSNVGDNGCEIEEVATDDAHTERIYRPERAGISDTTALVNMLQDDQLEEAHGDDRMQQRSAACADASHDYPKPRVAVDEHSDSQCTTVASVVSLPHECDDGMNDQENSTQHEQHADDDSVMWSYIYGIIDKDSIGDCEASHYADRVHHLQASDTDWHSSETLESNCDGSDDTCSNDLSGDSSCYTLSSIADSDSVPPLSADLRDAIRNCDHERVDHLISCLSLSKQCDAAVGVSVDVQAKELKSLIAGSSDNEHTSLHVASSEGNVSTLKDLLLNDCDIDALNANGETGLWIAVRARHLECITLLLEHGANLHIAPHGMISNVGAFPIIHNDIKVLMLLFKYGLNVSEYFVDRSLFSTNLFLLTINTAVRETNIIEILCRFSAPLHIAIVSRVVLWASKDPSRLNSALTVIQKGGCVQREECCRVEYPKHVDGYESVLTALIEDYAQMEDTEEYETMLSADMCRLLYLCGDYVPPPHHLCLPDHVYCVELMSFVDCIQKWKYEVLALKELSRIVIRDNIQRSNSFHLSLTSCGLPPSLIDYVMFSDYVIN